MITMMGRRIRAGPDGLGVSRQRDDVRRAGGRVPELFGWGVVLGRGGWAGGLLRGSAGAEHLGLDPVDRLVQDSAQVVYRVLADCLGLPGRRTQFAAELPGQPLEIAIGVGVGAAVWVRCAG